MGEAPPEKFEYVNGFSRCMRLSGAVEDGPLYSTTFEEALRRYFGKRMSHPRISHWWEDHTRGRVQRAFREFLPWVERRVLITGVDVVEVGCGTGSSTVALAALARHVVALDIDEPSLAAARQRLEEDGLSHKVSFRHVGSGLQGSRIEPRSVRVVICYSVLAHMTPEERQQCVDLMWTWLVPEGMLVVFETPNRLYPFDHHTTQLWFWAWLPPRLALLYGKARGKFEADQTLEGMFREGYGLTYHELERLFSGKDRAYVVPSIKEGTARRIVTSCFMSSLRVPRWGLARDLNVVVRKET